MSPHLRASFRNVILAAVMLVSSAAATEACSCVAGDSRAACELYKKFDVAFVGRAVSVPPNRAGGPVRFRVTQALKGITGTSVSIDNEESGMGCGYQFQQGDDYVVLVTRRADGTLEVERCSSTIWHLHPPDWAAARYKRESAEAEAFAESMRKPATGGRIFGEVRVDVPFSSEADNDEGMKLVDGATVMLQGPNDERRTTSVNGRYEFTGLPRGRYRVSVTMPDGLPPAKSDRPPQQLVDGGDPFFSFEHEYARSVTIADDRSCGYAPFAGEFEGEIAGSVVGADGKPAVGTAVEIFPAAVDPRADGFYAPGASVDPQGAYRFQRLPPGRYIVGVNLRDDLGPTRATPYRQPGEEGPSIVELGTDAHVDLGVLRLPSPSVKRHITGTVKWSDGRALGRVRVEAYQDRPGILGSISVPARVGADGAFSIDLFEGRTYILKAEAADPRGWWDRAADKEIPPVASTAFTITVDADRKDLVLLIAADRDPEPLVLNRP